MYFHASKINKPAMRQRSFIALAAAIATLLVGAAAVYAYDSSNDDQIAHGVKAGGIDIGDMSTAAARTKLRHDLGLKLGRPLEATYKHTTYTLYPRRAKVRIDVRGMVAEALKRSRSGNLFSRAARSIFGGTVTADIPVRVSYDRAAVAALVRRVARGVDRRAQDASVDFSTGVLKRVRSRNGRAVKRDALTQDIATALAQPDSARRVSVATTTTRPKVTTKQVAAKYPTVITIYRAGFTLSLYKHLRKVKTYTIAVGRQGLETPAGEYPVVDKQINPSWHVPNSSWAGKLAGQVIPPGPTDPLKARWIGITGGAGIHGTTDIGSLGSAASHGCIRMAIPDVIELFNRTPYGSRIFIQ
jgi:lipoprotein-anchoring transpeptidase ErfK/SrfK